MTFGTPIKRCREIGKTSEELGLKTDNNWQVSQKTIDEYEVMQMQNAINWAKMKHTIVGQLYVSEKSHE